ncbi:hypothetical protein JCM8115_005277 [Rhodotorula mucilaginosa]
MPDHPRKQRRTRSRSPSLDPPRRATIKDLSEEAIDLVCAFIRDENITRIAIETLCSLIRTARLFHSSAKRALLHDPTRALVNNKIVWLWHRMSSLMQELLRKPALGLHVKRLDYFPEVKRRAARSGSFSSVDTDSELCDGTPRGVCCGDPPDLDEQQSVGDFEDQQNRSEDDDDDWVLSDWLRGVSVSESDIPDYERFSRDGVSWHWKFDARGRPTAVPDDLAFYPPAAASADEAALSDDEDDVGTEASVEYLPPFPDVPRLEDGYEAHDADDDDGEGDGFGPEPWLTWSEFCDFDAADSAWVRFDIDDEGEEMSSSEGEVNEEEECESEDDELVSEDGLPPRF